MTVMSNGTPDRLSRAALVPGNSCTAARPPASCSPTSAGSAATPFSRPLIGPGRIRRSTGPATVRHNPLMVAETLRQLGLCVPLGFYGVGPDEHFLIERLSFDLDALAEPHAGYGGTDVVCQVDVDGIRPGAGKPLRGYRIHIRFQADGAVFAEAEGSARVLTPAAFAVIRNRRTGPQMRSPGDRCRWIPGGRRAPGLGCV